MNPLRSAVTIFAALLLFAARARSESAPEDRPKYCIVATGQARCFGASGQLLKAPRPGDPFQGQDAFYQGPKAAYRDNGDGTVNDLATGLQWQKSFDLGRKQTFAEARDAAKTCRLAGHADWRLPTVKELYSLIDFNGDSRAQPPVPYLDVKAFDFEYGDEIRILNFARAVRNIDPKAIRIVEPDLTPLPGGRRRR